MLLLDVRALPPSRKHTTVYEMLEKLDPSEALRITNDHDPRPLRLELDHDYPNTYEFAYLESGPETWVIDVIRRVQSPDNPSFEFLARSDGVSVSAVRLTSGATLPSHRVGDLVAIVVGEGKLFVDVAGRKRSLRAGDTEIVPRYVPHTLECVEPATAYVIRVQGAPVVAPWAPDLRNGVARSGRLKLGRYTWLAHLADRARAHKAGTLGGQSAFCPISFGFLVRLSVTPDEFSALIAADCTDEQLVAYLDARVNDVQLEAANHWVLVDNAESLRVQDGEEERVPELLSKQNHL